MKNVIVIGANHHNTLGVIWALGDANIQHDLILVTEKKKPFVAASKYPSNIILSKSEEDTLSILKSLAKDKKDSVLIACYDGAASLLDENKNELSQYYTLPGCDKQGELTRLMNKQTMGKLAVEAGLKLPSSPIIIDKNIDTSLIKFPCLLKQLVTKNTGKKQIIFHTKEELDNYIQNNKTTGDEFLQSFITKQFEYQLIGCSIRRERERERVCVCEEINPSIIIPGFSKILRPCTNSNTSFLHYSELQPDTCDIDACRKFITLTGYQGLFSMEFLRGEDGNDYFMEINFRNDGNAVCVTSAGINLPAIWAKACSGLDYTEELSKQISPIYCMPEFNEFRLALHRKITLKEFFSDLRKTNRFMDYYKKDPSPFFREIIESIKTFIRHITKF